MTKFYLTTAIDYVNNKPHIGHAYEKIAADVLARYWRFQKAQVLFQTGTDEHGLKIAKAAEAAGENPQKFADEISKKFKKSWQNLEISYDNFVRTTDPEHEKKVQKYLNKLKNDGYIYKDQYHGYYCLSCEEYKNINELNDKKCEIHQKVCQKLSEEVYFFKLSKFQNKIYRLIKDDKLEIKPQSRKNEILSFLKNHELKDVAISRSKVKWGIPIPWDKNHTVYVWVDALFNYLTGPQAQKFWPANIHIIGKDILRFHAVIWPAILLALKLPLPKKIFAHGFIKISGQKMSKTLGNVLDPNKVIKKYGTDTLRYFLLREFSFGDDGDVSLARIAERYHADLANDLGNLVQRVLAMAKKHLTINNQQLTINNSKSKEIENLDFKIALDKIWDLIIALNQEIDKEKPWELAKKNKQKLSKFLNDWILRIGQIALLLAPFMPKTSQNIAHQIKTLEIKPLFPKIK